MTRYIAPLSVVFALATTAHAQNYVTQSYTTTDAYGNSVTTTVQAPGSAVGLIANQAFNNGGYVNGGGYINGGFANGGFNVYYGGSSPVYYGNYPSYYGGYGGYAGYPNYGGYYGNNGYYGGGLYCPPSIPAPVVPAQKYTPSPNSNTPRTYIPGQSNYPARPGVMYNGMSIGATQR